jgi:uncharacterized protein YdaU (DUF1376 family)
VRFFLEGCEDAEMHYYKFNIADYRKDTGHLSTIEHGIFRQLIDWYYLDEQPIPLETQVVLRRLRLGSDDLIFLENVLSDFFQKTAKGYIHKRIELEIREYHGKAETNKVNGKRGGRPKKTQSVISGLPDQSQNNPNQEPITINHKPKRESATVVACPPDVGLQEWEDWLSLRKAKKAPVTETVLKSARKEAEKAGITLNAFLTIWCARGSQGLEASWLKSDEKQNQNETVYQRSMRLKMQEAVPSIAKHAPYQDASDFFRTIDMDSQKAIEVNK